MTMHPSSSPVPDFPPPHQDRHRLRRWSVIGGTMLVALIMVGAAAMYAGTALVDDGESVAGDLIEPTAPPPSALPSPPPVPTQSEEPGWVFCREVEFILGEVVGAEDYVENRRYIADQLRQLEAPTPIHRAALDDLINEFEAAAQMVEDDPSAESEALERDRAAQFAFIDSGGCDPA